MTIKNQIELAGDTGVTSGRVVDIAVALRDALKARGLTATAFPARRVDEAGWRQRHELRGRVLKHQLSSIIPNCFSIFDDQINSFCGDVAQHVTPETLSARLRNPVGFECVHVEMGGFWVRLVTLKEEDAVRIDVLLG